MAKPFNISRNTKAIVETKKKIDNMEKETKKEEIIKAPLSKISMHPDNELIYGNTENKERIAELAEDIKENGLLTPLQATIDENGNYIIFAGNTRYLACELINYEPVDLIVREYDDFTIGRSLISSNNNREKTSIQKANEIEYLRTLYSKYQKSFPEYLEGKSLTEKIAEDLKVDIATVQRADRLNRVDPQIKEAVEKNIMSATSAQRLADIDSNTQKEIAITLKEENQSITKEETKKIVDTNKKYEQEIEKLKKEILSTEKKKDEESRKKIDNLKSVIENLREQKTTEIKEIIVKEKHSISFIVSSIEYNKNKIIKDFDFLKKEIESDKEKEEVQTIIDSLISELEKIKL